ncbi:TPA: 30S ribosomal protein S13 [Candidatus Bathyarchaeota archaeon]|nr:30S ribosomal protein S13 [Candidatus Bathyarchaeota archaeon]
MGRVPEFRRIVRICGTDLDGTIKLAYGLSRIKGVGIRLAHAVMTVAKLDPEMRLGQLSDGDVARVESIIKDPLSYGISPWLVNRRRDRETGDDLHLIGSDLVLRTKMDIDFLKKIGCRRGIRHALGLKVRGQRTKATGRRGVAVGVRRKRRR